MEAAAENAMICTWNLVHEFVKKRGMLNKEKKGKGKWNRINFISFDPGQFFYETSQSNYHMSVVVVECVQF